MYGMTSEIITSGYVPKNFSLSQVSFTQIANRTIYVHLNIHTYIIWSVCYLYNVYYNIGTLEKCSDRNTKPESDDRNEYIYSASSCCIH